jgi:hypothetical protein
MALTQSQLNAAVIVRALSDIGSINTDPRFGHGLETLKLVREHIIHWDLHDMTELMASLNRIIPSESELKRMYICGSDI